MDSKRERDGFSFPHLIGFLSSLLMTGAAAFIALQTSLSFQLIMWIIGILALLQSGLQLVMFMHVNQGEQRIIQIINLAYGVFMAVVIVVGTIWVVSGMHIR